MEDQPKTLAEEKVSEILALVDKAAWSTAISTSARSKLIGHHVEDVEVAYAFLCVERDQQVSAWLDARGTADSGPARLSLLATIRKIRLLEAVLQHC